jgi:hypothetical protein
VNFGDTALVTFVRTPDGDHFGWNAHKSVNSVGQTVPLASAVPKAKHCRFVTSHVTPKHKWAAIGSH